MRARGLLVTKQHGPETRLALVDWVDELTLIHSKGLNVGGPIEGRNRDRFSSFLQLVRIRTYERNSSASPRLLANE